MQQPVQDKKGEEFNRKFAYGNWHIDIVADCVTIIRNGHFMKIMIASVGRRLQCLDTVQFY